MLNRPDDLVYAKVEFNMRGSKKVTPNNFQRYANLPRVLWVMGSNPNPTNVATSMTVMSKKSQGKALLQSSLNF